MPRRNRPARRPKTPDVRHGSVLAGQFINKLMIHGKKATSERLFYDALDLVEQRMKKPGIEVFEQAVRNASPLVEVKPRRVGGSTYQVPVEVRPERRTALALRWLIDSARKRGGKGMTGKLAAELMDAANNAGPTVRKREEIHRMAEANRAFAHYRW